MTESCSSASPNDGEPLPETRAVRRRQELETRKRRLTPEELQDVVRNQGVLAMSCEVGIACVLDMMEADATFLCGVKQKGKHAKGRTGYRNGYESGSIVMGGQQVSILRPRAIGLLGGELTIATYQEAREASFLSEAALVACIMGVSQRKHCPVAGAMAPLGKAAADPIGLSKSAVGRRFADAADKKVTELLERPLNEQYEVVWLDGVHEGEYTMMCAVGLTSCGRKVVLGLRDGSKEDRVLCCEFFEDLRQRGFSADRGVLFVMDGGKAMASALREVFGAHVAIQRCQIHKKRNILEKLLEGDRDEIGAELEQAWDEPDAKVAEAKLELLATKLEARGHQDAAASIREGLREMVTCTRLGIPRGLFSSLTNTNVIESSFSQQEAITRRVKRWRNGEQAVRWAGISLLEAEKSFNTVGTPEQLAALRVALQRHADESSVQLTFSLAA